MTTGGGSYGAPVAPAQGSNLGAVCYLEIANVGANALQVYFTKADYDAGTNYRTVPTTAGALNPYQGPADLNDGATPRPAPVVWLKGVSGSTTAEIIFYHRRN